MTKNKRSRYDDDALEEKLSDGVESVNTDSASVTNQLDAESVKAENATIGGGEIFKRVDRRNPSNNISSITFSGLKDDAEYRLFYNVNCNDSTNLFVRADGDGDATGDYQYWDSSSTRQNGEDEILLVSISSSSYVGGILTFDNLRYTRTEQVGFNNSLLATSFGSVITDFSREGGKQSSGLNSITLEVSSGEMAADETIVELWERDYS